MYQSSITLGAVALNVRDLHSQTKFYTNVLGLIIIELTDTKVVFGVESTKVPLIILFQIDVNETNNYGLYHFALRLPTRSDLGDILKHFIAHKTPLIVESDHGNTEAIYLEDLEGNGIEIFRDRPMENWDIRGDKI